MWVVNDTPRQSYPRKRNPVPILYEAVSVPLLFWTFAENRQTTGFEPRILESIASTYTDCSIPGQNSQKESLGNIKSSFHEKTGILKFVIS